MLEQFIIRDETQSALRAMGSYRLIDEVALDSVKIRTETMPAALADQQFIRIRVSHISDSKRNSYTRTMVWPVANADNPVELAVITRKIVDAALPVKKRRDPRSLTARILHNISRKRLINHVEDIAVTEVKNMGKIRLSATIYEDAPDIRTVTLYQFRPHRRVIALNLPMSTVKRLQEWALDAASFS